MESSSSIVKSPLDRYVGAWLGEVFVEQAGSEPRRYIQSNSFSWILDGRFLEERGQGSDGSSFAGIWLFDSTTSLYHAHYFMAPSGSAVIITHRWEEQVLSFKGSATLPGGMRMLAEDVFIDRDQYRWSIAIEDAQGNAVSRMQALERRVGP